MSEMLKEIGKAILQFANIIAGLVLFKTFIENGDLFLFIVAIVVLITFYVVGSLLIKKGENYE